MSILLAKLSLIAAVLSTCALVFSWLGKFVMKTHDVAIGLFFASLCLSATAVMTGGLAIFKLCELKERRIALFGAVMGLLIFVPTGAVVIILLVIFLNGNRLH